MSALFDGAPPYWRWIRLKDTVTNCQSGVWGGEPLGGEDDVICVRAADLDRARLRVTLRQPTVRSVRPAARHGRLLATGDLLLEKSGGTDTQPVGVVALYDQPARAICSNFLARMPAAPGFNPWFLCYLHAALYHHGVTVRSVKQTTGIQNLDAGSYLAEPVRVPELAEQRRIADWLDQRTEWLAALTAKYRRLVDLLRERRLSIISRALTRSAGWLGAVPSHWRVTRLKYIRLGALLYGAAEEGEPPNPLWPRYIRVTDLTEEGTLREDAVRSLPPDLAAPYLLEDGDILLARSGATVGKAVPYRAAWGPACFAGYLVRLRPDRTKVLPEYLAYYTQSHGFRQAVAMQIQQATVANVSAERYANFPIELPPLAEQSAIVEYLDRHTRGCDSLAVKARLQIARLGEYREALVAAAVTGRIGAGSALARGDE